MLVIISSDIMQVTYVMYVLLIKTILESVVRYIAFYNLEVLTCIRQLEVIATKEAI